MKNQSDLIALIVAVSLTLVSAILFLFMKRDTVVLAAPTEVVTSPAALPAGDVIMTNGLPAGGGGGGGGRGMSGMSSGKAGFMGGMGGGPGGGMGGPKGAPQSKAPGFAGGGAAAG